MNRKQSTRLPAVRWSCRLLAVVALALPMAGRAADKEKGREKEKEKEKDKVTGLAKWESYVSGVEQAERRKPTPPGGMVFAGSSSIRMWNLKAAFPDLPVVNRGFGGTTIRDSTVFASRLLAPLKPSVVVFYAGDNDSAAGRTAEQMVADFRAFAAWLHQGFPAARLIYLPIKPSLARWKLRPVQARTNDAIAAWCRENPDWLTYLDTATPLLGQDGKPDPGFFKDDGLHLNETGYAVWNRVLDPELRRAPSPPTHP